MTQKDNKIEFKEEKGKVTFLVDTKLFPSDTVYQTAYVFTSKAYVSLDGDPEGVLKISLRWKDENYVVKDIQGEFENELLNQTVRAIVNYQNATTKEAIISRALVTASGNKEFDDILSDLDSIDDLDIDAELEKIEQELQK